MQFLRDMNYVLRSVWQDESNRKERVKRVLLAGGWQMWKRLIRKPIVVLLFNGMRFRAYPDCSCSSATIYTRIPNSKYLSFFRKHLNGGTLVDIGANVGMVSLLLADRVQNAWLFEPNPMAVARIHENLDLNRLNFEVHQCALSDRTGSVEFETLGGVSPCNRTLDGVKTLSPTITVPCTTFDQFFNEHGPPAIPISAIKIDVEGHENAVLRGMEHFLRAQRPRLIMFEYLQRTNLVETFEILSRVGYRIVELTREGPRCADAQVAPLQDLFACPEELLARLIPQTT